jgi:hypothetical protein
MSKAHVTLQRPNVAPCHQATCWLICKVVKGLQREPLHLDLRDLNSETSADKPDFHISLLQAAAPTSATVRAANFITFRLTCLFHLLAGPCTLP